MLYLFVDFCMKGRDSSSRWMKSVTRKEAVAVDHRKSSTTPQVTGIKATHTDLRWICHHLAPRLNSPLCLRLSFWSEHKEREKEFLLLFICLLFVGIFVLLCIIGKNYFSNVVKMDI